jgi:peptidoglycan/LPS O-acetylase OafA/YrhL
MALVSITSAIAVVLTVHPSAVRTRRLLGSDAMAAIGRRSYSIYLWHWPVFVVVGATAGSWPRFIVGLAIALLLSEACYRFVEMPIRHGALGALWARRRPIAVVAGGLAASTAAVLGIALAQVGSRSLPAAANPARNRHRHRHRHRTSWPQRR